LEFYLTTTDGRSPIGVTLPSQGISKRSENVLSVGELDAFSPFFDDVYAACAAQNIPADAAISEGGLGQFEINLLHGDDPLKAADDALLFKTIVRGVAKKHGFVATFMAKPFGDQPGNGLHIHFSVLDSDGQNIFDDGTDEGSDLLKFAVGGLLDAMPESMLIFAPHQNSYRRLRPESHAPTYAAWGYENRTCAIRIPGGSHKARRIEHRLSGADANPYMVLAAILGAALHGIEGKVAPSPALTGNAYDTDAPQLPLDWRHAISTFSAGEIMANVFDSRMIRLFAQAKQQELNRFLDCISEAEFHAYLETV
jgi:glutamine synthetase